MFHRPKTIVFAATAAVFVALPSFADSEILSPQDARHLISRTGFGAAPHEISALTGLSREDAVAQILGAVTSVPHSQMPAWVSLWDYPKDEIWSLGTTAEDLFFANRHREIEELSEWWIAEMVSTPSPLTERLTLFWHDHFATSFYEVENSQWMAAQNQMFRRDAAGNFATLAEGILRDPAMLVWLDNVENFAESPNENLAREYLELFTLGEGNGYTEVDVKEVARALTGHGVQNWAGSGYAFHEDVHDDGQKTILGQTGHFDASDLPAIVLNHPDFGPYIVEKLWLNFVSDTPDKTEIARLTDLWKAHDLEIAPLLEALFLTEAFWDPANRGRLVKSPIELAVGTIRNLGMEGVSIPEIRWTMEELGQTLFFPPNAGGWTAGAGWITDASALGRASFMTYAVEHTGEMIAPTLSTMAGANPQVASGAGAYDLRIGRTFLIEAEFWNPQDEGAEGTGAVLTLFDVSFAGETWRSITVVVEEEDGALPSIGLWPGDCAPACLYGADWDLEEDEGWVWTWLEPEEAMELVEGQPADARAFLASLTAHLPEIMRSTHGQLTWLPNTEEGEQPEATPTYDEMAAFAERVKRAGAAAFGVAPGAYVIGQSAPNTLGLAGLEAYSTMGDPDGYFDAVAISAMPSTLYPTTDAWIAALPNSMTPTEALLAVPLTTNELTGNARDILEILLLAPEYQLN